MDNNAFTYYLAILQLQMAILGFVIAGIVALMQMLSNAKPRRNPSLLIKQPILIGYMGFLALSLVAVALGCWVTAFQQEATSMVGVRIVELYNNSAVLLFFLVSSLLSLFVFAYLTYRARKLLDARDYLQKYISHVSTSKIRAYLTAVYESSDIKSSPHPVKLERVIRNSSNNSKILYDPFQPIREYIKDNAFKSYDYGTAAGLKFFGQTFDKTLAAIEKDPQENEFYYLARYTSENAIELFMIFEKTSSEKRKMDIIRLIRIHGEMLLAAGGDEGILTVIRALEGIAKLARDDDEIIAAITAIHYLTDLYLARHPKASWKKIAPIFEDICLSVTRISETYYLQNDNPLKTVPIIGHATGEHQTVTAALVGFFCSYRDLADRYTDTYPKSYFEAIEAVVEALFARLAEISNNGQQYIGLNSTYNKLAYSLYSLYSVFGLDAIEHKKPELLALCMGNLRRVIKPAKNLGLDDERRFLTQMFIELAVKGVNELGDVLLKGERTITMYALETLDKHATAETIDESIDLLQHKDKVDFKIPDDLMPFIHELQALHRHKK
jgi:hypothetical protein